MKYHLLISRNQHTGTFLEIRVSTPPPFLFNKIQRIFLFCFFVHTHVYTVLCGYATFLNFFRKGSLACPIFYCLVRYEFTIKGNSLKKMQVIISGLHHWHHNPIPFLLSCSNLKKCIKGCCGSANQLLISLQRQRHCCLSAKKCCFGIFNFSPSGRQHSDLFTCKGSYTSTTASCW